jgi:hypothetical protein
MKRPVTPGCGSSGFPPQPDGPQPVVAPAHPGYRRWSGAMARAQPHRSRCPPRFAAGITFWAPAGRPLRLLTSPGLPPALPCPAGEPPDSRAGQRRVPVARRRMPPDAGSRAACPAHPLMKECRALLLPRISAGQSENAPKNPPHKELPVIIFDRDRGPSEGSDAIEQPAGQHRLPGRGGGHVGGPVARLGAGPAEAASTVITLTPGTRAPGIRLRTVPGAASSRAATRIRPARKSNCVLFPPNGRGRAFASTVSVPVWCPRRRPTRRCAT